MIAKRSKSGTAATLGQEEAVALVLQKHHLTRQIAGSTVLRVIDDVIGLHATYALSPFLQLRARIEGFAARELTSVLDRGKAAKVPCMRRTLFIETARHVPLILTATRSVRAQQRSRFMAASGLTSRLYQRLSERVENAVAGRAMDMRELQSSLHVEHSLSPVVILMCDDARLVRWKGPGGWQSGRPTYRRFEEVVPARAAGESDEQTAVGRLVDWYVRRYGPVTEDDVVWWTGLPARVIREAIADNPAIVAARLGSSTSNYVIHEADLARPMPDDRSAAQELSLLPVLDPYLQGYRRRERSIDPELQHYVVDGGGNVTSVILAAGRVIGIWDFIRQGGELRVLFFGRTAPETRRRVQRYAADLGQFIADRPMNVVEVDHMLPLVDARAGAVLSPLGSAARRP